MLGGGTGGVGNLAGFGYRTNWLVPRRAGWIYIGQFVQMMEACMLQVFLVGLLLEVVLDRLGCGEGGFFLALRTDVELIADGAGFGLEIQGLFTCS